jgi:hypothetical protein
VKEGGNFRYRKPAILNAECSKKELYNFERVYKFIQRTYTTF